MFVFRFFGWWILAGAFVAFIVDGTKTIAASHLVVTPLGRAWFELHPPSLNLFQAIVERYTFSFLWDPVIVYILFLPSWAVLAAIGILFMVIGRKRAPARVVINQD